MAVETDKFNSRKTQSVAGYLLRLSGLDCGTEFRVDHTGIDRGIGMRVNTRSEPEQNLLLYASPLRLRINCGELFNIINNKVSDTDVHRICDVAVGLVV